MLTGTLSKQTILNRIHHGIPLISDYLNLQEQIQPNGFDCTLRSVEILTSSAQISTDNSDRKLPDTELVKPNDDDYYELTKGPYLITLNEIVNAGGFCFVTLLS